MTPTRDQLASAHLAADLKGTLDDALRDPLLARCLAMQAEAIARGIRASTLAEDRTQQCQPPQPLKAPQHDFKRACAADMDD